MSPISRLRALVRHFLFRERVDRDLADELQSYVGLVADEQYAQGETVAQARRQGRLALGGMAAVTEAVRAARAGAGLDRLWLDVRYAIRGLVRAPAFSAMAGLTIMLGIGANTAVFSLIDAAVFKPLPYEDPDHLVEIATVLDRGTEAERRQIGITWRQLEQWREETALFSAIETIGNPRSVTLGEGTAAGATSVVRISPALTTMLGVAPVLGREFVPEDTHPDVRVALLAETYWKRAFKGDAAVVGRVLTIDRVPHQIIGVMPATLSWGLGGRSVAAWLPLDEATERRASPLPFVGTIARIRPGLTLEHAERLLDAAAERRHVGSHADVDLYRIDTNAGASRTGLKVTFGAVGVVLLIGCANVANLLLVRIIARRREIAVRAALGATRGRLMRQFVVEGLVLASIAGIGAIALAFWSAGVWPAVIPEELRFFEANLPAIDMRALAFCSAAVVLTGLLCSVLPAIRAGGPDILHALEGSARLAGATIGGRRLRFGLQATQVALTVVLLSGAGLLAASFVRMTRTDAGYDVDRLAMASLVLPAAPYPDSSSRTAFFSDVLTRVQKIPGVRAAYGHPPASGPGAARFIPFGQEDVARDAFVEPFRVDAEYFSVAGIPLRAGRLFNAGDGPASPDVALIDERAAAIHWPSQSAIGQRFRFRASEQWVTVIGVVGHVKVRNFTERGGTIQAYLPLEQAGEGVWTRFRTLILRTDEPQAALASVRAIVNTVDPAVETRVVERVSSLYDDVLVTPRFYLIVMTLLAAIALITAAVGLSAVLNYSVNQRTREIGVRMVLGADPRGVRNLVVREAMLPVAVGAAGGLVACVWLTRVLESQLYETTPHDPLTFGVVILTLLIVAAVAAFFPARRATRLDPVMTLRAE